MLLGLVLTKKSVPGNAGQGLEQTGMVEVALSMARDGNEMGLEVPSGTNQSGILQY